MRVLSNRVRLIWVDGTRIECIHLYIYTQCTQQILDYRIHTIWRRDTRVWSHMLAQIYCWIPFGVRYFVATVCNERYKKRSWNTPRSDEQTNKKVTTHCAPAERQSKLMSDDFEWSIDACDTNLSAWENEIEMNNAWEHSQVLIVYFVAAVSLLFAFFVSHCLSSARENGEDRSHFVVHFVILFASEQHWADMLDDKKRKRFRRKKSLIERVKCVEEFPDDDGAHKYSNPTKQFYVPYILSGRVFFLLLLRIDSQRW